MIWLHGLLPNLITYTAGIRAGGWALQLLHEMRQQGRGQWGRLQSDDDSAGQCGTREWALQLFDGMQ